MNTITKTSINNIIPFKDFRVNSEKYIKAISNGMSFVVVKRSKPIFRLEPMGESWETLIDFTDGGKKRGIPVDELLEHIKNFKKKQKINDR
ncbi:MAG: hypothetical protein WCX27_00160 [Candidatus Paceibacterota bacterium]|jgi:hypothetical protein